MPLNCKPEVAGRSLDPHSASAFEMVVLDQDSLAVSLLEESEDGIKLVSLDGTLEFMNCNGLEPMDINRRDRVLQKLWWDLWPAYSQSFVRGKFRTAARGRTVVFDAMCPTAQGKTRYWSVNLKPLFANRGPVVSVLVTSRAIPLPNER